MLHEEHLATGARALSPWPELARALEGAWLTGLLVLLCILVSTRWPQCGRAQTGRWARSRLDAADYWAIPYLVWGLVAVAEAANFFLWGHAVAFPLGLWSEGVFITGWFGVLGLIALAEALSRLPPAARQPLRASRLGGTVVRLAIIGSVFLAWGTCVIAAGAFLMGSPG